MTNLNLAPVLCPDSTGRRTSFVAPTGTFYLVGTPSVGLSQELIDSKIVRVVFSAREARPDWPQAQIMLNRAGIEVKASFQKTD